MIKQKNIPWLGALVDALYTSLPILSIVNFLSIVSVLYATTWGYIQTWAPWMTFKWFILMMCILVTGLMVFVYKFIVQSLWSFRGRQMHTRDSNLVREVRELRKEIEELKNAQK